VSTSVELGGFVSYRAEGVRYRVRIRRDVAGATDGWLADGQVTYRVLDTSKLYVNVSGQVTWANARYMQVWFGVTPAQSVASGLPVYNAHSGLRDATVSASAEYVLSDRWSVLGTFGYTRLLSSAANNPLVKQRGSANQPSMGAFVIYAF
jgi:outer membrane protein